MACCPTQAIICEMLMKEPGEAGQEWNVITEITLTEVRADPRNKTGSSAAQPLPRSKVTHSRGESSVTGEAGRGLEVLRSSGHIKVGGKTSGASSRPTRLDSGGHYDLDIKWVGGGIPKWVREWEAKTQEWERVGHVQRAKSRILG